MNKLCYKGAFIFLLTIIFTFKISCQEVLTNLIDNPVLKNVSVNNYKYSDKTSSTDTIELPFFDDFSLSFPYPDASLWIDKFVYINSSYPVNPPSVGVATLDALNFDGSQYNNDSIFSSFIADIFTSKPINLEYPIESNIFLSFFFQPGGKGNMPEENDSLYLEFYSTYDSAWHNVWDTCGFESNNFTQIILPVNNTIYLKKGFQFRFKNLVSFNGSYPDAQSNVDIWHIDYIKIDTGRNINDTVLHDVALTQATSSLLKNFEAMPWLHFNPLNDLGDVTFNFVNNDIVTRNINLVLDIKTLVEPPNDSIQSFYLGGANYLPGEIVNYKHGLDEYPIEDNPFYYIDDSIVIFEIKCYMETDEFDNHKNDTAYYFQKFDNYYSYDDGSSENGYGIIGEGAKNAMLAYKFKIDKKDTLRAVKMYFNQSLQNESQQYFILTVWDDNNGQPGNVINKQISFKPFYENSLNKFHTYILDSSIYINGTFYIGWVQTTNKHLNLGFDRNRNRQSKIFYNLGAGWYNSSFEGALMIRPIFGEVVENPTSLKNIVCKNNPLKIFPVPAYEYINISLSENIDCKKTIYSIYNQTGQLVRHGTLLTNKINISNLNNGIYFLVLNTSEKVLKEKFIIIH
ncbi:MAG: T9SS type A sorting domain-containing protein [Bacteroidales bacterium]|nr:T9SS type A sorting domain-containing protein [Bacteroidales bacterium]